MTEDTNQITADHLRAEFLNASTNWQRWKVLNKALDWAVTARENAAAAREQATELKERIEARPPKAAGFTAAPFNRDAAAEMVTGVRIRHQGSEETTPEQKTGDYFWSPDADGEDLAGWFVPEENYAAGTARLPETHQLRVSQGHPAADLKTRVEGSTAKAAGPEGMPASDDIAARLGFVTPEELARNAWTPEEQARNAWTSDTMFTGHVVMQPKEDDR